MPDVELANFDGLAINYGRKVNFNEEVCGPYYRFFHLAAMYGKKSTIPPTTDVR